MKPSQILYQKKKRQTNLIALNVEHAVSFSFPKLKITEAYILIFCYLNFASLRCKTYDPKSLLANNSPPDNKAI